MKDYYLNRYCRVFASNRKLRILETQHCERMVVTSVIMLQNVLILLQIGKIRIEYCSTE